MPFRLSDASFPSGLRAFFPEKRFSLRWTTARTGVETTLATRDYPGSRHAGIGTICAVPDSYKLVQRVGSAFAAPGGEVVSREETSLFRAAKALVTP